jgi:hypothetical protein
MMELKRVGLLEVENHPRKAPRVKLIIST